MTGQTGGSSNLDFSKSGTKANGMSIHVSLRPQRHVKALAFAGKIHFKRILLLLKGTFSLFRTCAMAMSKRLTVDPCLGVSDIMAPFLQFFKEQGKYDMRALIEPKVQATWKTAPDPEWLASLHPLWMKVLRVAPACILPSKKLKDALEKIQREITRLNFSRVSDEVYFDSMDQLIRISASQLRTLKKDSAQYQRTMKKASISEKEKVDELLSCIKVPQSDINDATIPTVDSAMVASGSGNASGSGHASGSGNASGSGIGSGNASGSGNVAIFQQILQGLPTEEKATAGTMVPVAATDIAQVSKTTCRLTFDLSMDDKQVLAHALGLQVTPRSNQRRKPRKRKKSRPRSQRHPRR